MPDAVRYGVILVNWNGASDTIAALDSLRTSDPQPHYVVVVDNRSADDSLARLRAWANGFAPGFTEQGADGRTAPSWFTLLTSDSNRGYAGGNNVGLRFLRECSDATHFLLLNNDATVAPDFFAHMDDALRARPEAGLLTGTIYEDPARDRVWYAGGRAIPLRALVAHELQVPAGGVPLPTEFVSGCVMLISRELLDRNGPLPECYFPLYSEDAEYSWRAAESGFPVLYAPRAVAWHKVGATVGPARGSPPVTRTQIRHRFFYVRRNFRGSRRALALAYLIATKPGRALVEAVRGRPRMAWAVIMGSVEGLTARF